MRTYQDRKGCCGESASLQVTMERLAGNTAFLVDVEVGAVGTTQSGAVFEITKPHACAAHITSQGQVIIIDTTSREGFGIGYDRFEILSDEHSLAKY